MCLLYWLASAQLHAGEPVFRVEISPEQSTLTVGEPLVLQMRVINDGSEAVDRASVGVGLFRLSWFTDYMAEDCEVSLFLTDAPQGGSQGFGFFWDIEDLEPGGIESCRVTFPGTLFSGTETIEYYLSTVDQENSALIIWDEGEFTYTLLPVHSEVPVELDAGVEQSSLQIGEPLVLNLRATNISGEPLAPFFVISHQLFQVAGPGDFSTDGCEVAATPIPAEPPGFGLDWFVPELQPGETATCRVTFPDTPSPGTETISFFAWVEGAAWEELAEITYAVLAEPPPVPVPVNSPVLLLLMVLMVLLLARRRFRGRKAWPGAARSFRSSE